MPPANPRLRGKEKPKEGKRSLMTIPTENDGTARSAFALDAHPAPRCDAVIAGDKWRITMLTESLVRFEWSDAGRFEDHATQTILNRDLGRTPSYRVTHSRGLTIVDTAALHIVYDGRPFSKEGLSVVVGGMANSQNNTWHYGDVQRGNLKGTARTLDEADGRIPLGDGVISRDGWAVLDDSRSNLIIETNTVNGTPNPFGTWVSPRDHDETDLYFFGYGHRYIEAVRDFYRLTGPTPLLPRFALGNWWSRYYRYSQDEYLQLMDRFKREGIPFTTSVIDMDWHRVDDVDPKYGSGWTGYSWNRTLFPDPTAFLRGLHERGLKTTLNVHPRDGIRAYEDAYPAVAERMGIDPRSGENVEFDPTSPDFMDAYFAMHHDMEAEGVDFWWLDWQQGGVTRQKGLDPLWMLNHMHYLDSARDGRWPLTFSRYAGPGSHRYPVGFSGDTVVTWESLAFQPEFTATASNIGYGWWSHDIGGHMFGYRDEELEARWYQLGAFSPINRLHSTCSPFAGKEPWHFEPGIRQSMVDSLRLRHAMIPYLYTMNYRAHEQGRPIVEPMYWHDPDASGAYEVPDEYRFGTELIVSPIVTPNDRAVQRGRTNVWLPQGDWFDLFSGRHYESRPAGGRRMEVWRPIDRIPVFAKAGGIVPLQPVAESGESINDIANPSALSLLVFPGASGEFTLREDDGRFGSRSMDTSIEFAWKPDGMSCLTILPVTGERSAGVAGGVPAHRDWTIVFRGVAPMDAGRISVWSDDRTVRGVETSYDPVTLSLTVQVAGIASSDGLRVELADGLRVADNPVEPDAMGALMHAQMRFRTKELAMQAIREQGREALDTLRTLDQPARYPGDFWISDMPDSVVGALSEILTRSRD